MCCSFNLHRPTQTAGDRRRERGCRACAEGGTRGHRRARRRARRPHDGDPGGASAADVNYQGLPDPAVGVQAQKNEVQVESTVFTLRVKLAPPYHADQWAPGPRGPGCRGAGWQFESKTLKALYFQTGVGAELVGAAPDARDVQPALFGRLGYIVSTNHKSRLHIPTGRAARCGASPGAADSEYSHAACRRGLGGAGVPPGDHHARSPEHPPAGRHRVRHLRKPGGARRRAVVVRGGLLTTRPLGRLMLLLLF
eukprot:970728-Prorocentrum_minimum.AAC.8